MMMVVCVCVEHLADGLTSWPVMMASAQTLQRKTSIFGLSNNDGQQYYFWQCMSSKALSTRISVHICVPVDIAGLLFLPKNRAPRFTVMIQHY